MKNGRATTRKRRANHFFEIALSFVRELSRQCPKTKKQIENTWGGRIHFLRIGKMKKWEWKKHEKLVTKCEVSKKKKTDEFERKTWKMTPTKNMSTTEKWRSETMKKMEVNEHEQRQKSTGEKLPTTCSKLQSFFCCGNFFLECVRERPPRQGATQQEIRKTKGMAGEWKNFESETKHFGKLKTTKRCCKMIQNKKCQIKWKMLKNLENETGKLKKWRNLLANTREKLGQTHVWSGNLFCCGVFFFWSGAGKGGTPTAADWQDKSQAYVFSDSLLCIGKNSWYSRKRMEGENWLVHKFIPMSRVGSNRRRPDEVQVGILPRIHNIADSRRDPKHDDWNEVWNRALPMTNHLHVNVQRHCMERRRKHWIVYWEFPKRSRICKTTRARTLVVSWAWIRKEMLRNSYNLNGEWDRVAEDAQLQWRRTPRISWIL